MYSQFAGPVDLETPSELTFLAFILLGGLIFLITYLSIGFKRKRSPSKIYKLSKVSLAFLIALVITLILANLALF